MKCSFIDRSFILLWIFSAWDYYGGDRVLYISQFIHYFLTWSKIISLIMLLLLLLLCLTLLYILCAIVSCYVVNIVSCCFFFQKHLKGEENRKEKCIEFFPQAKINLYDNGMLVDTITRNIVTTLNCFGYNILVKVVKC